MAIPELIDKYHLPPGEYECTIDEIEKRFGILNDTRKNVWECFKNLLFRFNQLEIKPEIILIDGSFVTGRELPGDVDFAMLIKPEVMKKAFKNASDDHNKRAIVFLCNPANQVALRDLFGAHPLIASDENSLAGWAFLFKKGGACGLKDTDPIRDPSWVKKPSEKGILKIIM